MNRGSVHAKKKEYDLAFCDFNEVVTLNPSYAAPYNKRGELNIKKNFIDRAIADITQAIRIRPEYVCVISIEVVRIA